MLRVLGLIVATGLLAGLQTEEKTFSPVEALDQIGRPQILVEMTVISAKDRLQRRGLIYLDSEDDFTAPKNLGIAISAGAAEKFKENGIRDIAGHFLGKTIQVRGCVMKFESRPYLPVHDPEQIRVVDDASVE